MAKQRPEKLKHDELHAEHELVLLDYRYSYDCNACMEMGMSWCFFCDISVIFMSIQSLLCIKNEISKMIWSKRQCWKDMCGNIQCHGNFGAKFIQIKGVWVIVSQYVYNYFSILKLTSTNLSIERKIPTSPFELFQKTVSTSRSILISSQLFFFFFLLWFSEGFPFLFFLFFFLL